MDGVFVALVLTLMQEYLKTKTKGPFNNRTSGYPY
jgi:hypothetical protein